MIGTIDLTPDQLSQLVCYVCEVNGYSAVGLSIWDGQQQLGFNRAVIHIEEKDKPLEVFPKPRQTMTREEMNALLYPNVGSGIGNGAAGT